MHKKNYFHNYSIVIKVVVTLETNIKKCIGNCIKGQPWSIRGAILVVVYSINTRPRDIKDSKVVAVVTLEA